MSGEDAVQEVNGGAGDARDGKKSRYSGWMTLVLIGGVFMPLAALVVEYTLRICSAIFFDPFPTYWHTALLLTVPLANLLAVIACLRGGAWSPRALVLLSGMAVGTGVVYSLQFAPMTPFSLLGIMALGIGLCGLTPYFGLGASIACTRKINRMRLVPSASGRRWFWAGFALAAGALVASAVSMYITNYGLTMAESSDENTSRRGVKLIRTLGSDAALLRACYGLPAGIWSISWLRSGNWNTASREHAREAYYRVTGKSFNSVPPPKLAGVREGAVSDFQFDSDVGGTAVNGRMTDLNMKSSRMDAVVDPGSLTGYTEWTLLFTNSAAEDREARAEVALPPGGAVSRLTLWVDGEPREAAFSTRGKVRQAYQEVAVVQRRDPVLVTSCGPDRVLVQCFPVPAGGSMKIRMGVTSPLRSNEMVLPHFVERNFGVPESLKHSVLVRSPRAIELEGMQSRPGSGGQNQLLTTVSDADLSAAARVSWQNMEMVPVWTPDRSDPTHYAILQTVEDSNEAAPDRVSVVIDGSNMVKGFMDDAAEAVAALPPGRQLERRFSVILASDHAQTLVPLQSVTSGALRKATDAIHGVRCPGGIDNRPALIKACTEAAAAKNGVVLWIHGPQPLTSASNTEELLQVLQMQGGGVRIYSVTAVDGRNTILSELESTGKVTAIPRRASLQDDLTPLYDSWVHPSSQQVIVRRRVPISAIGGAARGSQHIGRLWALEEVLRICRTGDESRLVEASKLAALYQIVSPASGAVVLETAQQYAETGLQPVDPKSVPVVTPEPETWVMLAAGAALIAAMCLKRRRVKVLDE